MNAQYRHTQVGRVILISMTLGALLAVALLWDVPGWVGPVMVGGLVVIGVLFGSLTVEVGQGRLRCWFGPGLIRKEFPLTEVTAVEAVRNHWYYGWGIRYTPDGWLFNVSGLDAVRITLRSGRQFRIGTDQPRELVRAIENAAGLSTG